MQHEINGKCTICREPLVKGENTCSCLPCNKVNKDCEHCFNDIFYCYECKIKRRRGKESRSILLERRAEKLEEIREIEQSLGIINDDTDRMFR